MTSRCQHAHAADQGLAGLRVFAGPEGGVLPFHHVEHVGQLLALGRGLPGSMAIEITVSGKAIDSKRIGSWTLRKTWRPRDRVAQADDADDVAMIDARSTCVRRSAGLHHEIGARSPSCPCPDCRPGCWPSTRRNRCRRPALAPCRSA